MSNENELKRLESFVSKLLKSFQDLKEENGRLTQTLQMRDETIVSLKDELAANDTERSEIGSRVGEIIEQIEEWEINLGEEVFDDVPSSDASRQGSLFSPAAASEDNEADQKDENYND